MPAKTFFRTSPPRLSVSLRSLSASFTSSASTTRHAHVDFREVVERAFCGQRLFRKRLGPVGGGRRGGPCCCGRWSDFLAVFNHGIHLLLFNPFHHVFKSPDARSYLRLRPLSNLPARSLC